MLYEWLIQAATGRRTLLIDLHTGNDPRAAGSDLQRADASLRAGLQAALRHELREGAQDVRTTDEPRANTVIPREVWAFPPPFASSASVPTCPPVRRPRPRRARAARLNRTVAQRSWALAMQSAIP